MIEYHNPEASVAIEEVPYALNVAIKGANAINIGFLANGFPDSERFLQELESAMCELEPGIGAFNYNKGNASVPASEELLSQLEGQCAAAIAAYGH